MKDKKIRKIAKFKTGDKIPDNAVYLSTLIENYPNSKIQCVYHYFLLHKV